MTCVNYVVVFQIDELHATFSNVSSASSSRGTSLIGRRREGGEVGGEEKTSGSSEYDPDIHLPILVTLTKRISS